MAEHTSIDLRTLEQVQHLLATTTFASIDDLAGRAGGLTVEAGSRRAVAEPTLDVHGAAPLPRRR